MKKKTTVTSQSILGFKYQLFFNSANLVVKILSLAILARLLEKEDFGIAEASLIVIGLSEIFVYLGFGNALIKIKNSNQKHLSVALSFSIITGLLTSVIIYYSAASISRMLNIPELIQTLRVISFFPLVSSLGIISKNLLLKNLEFKKNAQIEFFSYVVGYSPICILLAMNDYSYWALIWGSAAQIILSSSLAIYYSPYKFLLGFYKNEFKEMFHFGVGNSLGRIFNYFALKGDNFIIAKFLGGSSLGVYSRAYSLMNVSVSILGKSLDKVLFSSMSLKQNNNEKLSSAFMKVSSGLNLLIIPLSIFCMISAHEIIYVLLGPKWNEAVVPFRILSASMIFRVGYKISGSMARATGFVYSVARIQLVFALSIIVLCYFGAVRFGIEGAAYGSALAIFIQYIQMTYLSLKTNKSLRLITVVSNFKAPLVLGSFMTLFLFLIRWLLFYFGSGPFLTLASTIFLFTVVYGLLLSSNALHYLLSDSDRWCIDIYNQMKKRALTSVGLS